MASEDIGGGWQLDAQHKYNFHAGILQKGDGHTVYLKYKPHVSFNADLCGIKGRLLFLLPMSAETIVRKGEKASEQI